MQQSPKITGSSSGIAGWGLWRRDRNKPSGKLLSGLVGKTGKNDLIKTIRLILDRFDDVRVTMTVSHNPPR